MEEILKSDDQRKISPIIGNTSKNSGFDFKLYSTLLALLCLFIILGMVTQGSFFDPRNFTNLTRQISVNGILAVGMTMVILTSGIDLSVGSVVALSGIVAGIIQVFGGFAEMGAMGTLWSIFACLGTGILCGFLNGSLISFFSIPPFVITLGMMVVARGLALILSQSTSISPMSESFQWIAKGFIPPLPTLLLFGSLIVLWLFNFKSRAKMMKVGMGALSVTFLLEGICLAFPLFSFAKDRGLPIPTLALLLLSFLGIFILRKMPLGRYIYAIGGNEEAAALSGVPVTKVKLFVYTFIGFLAGISGVILTARLNSAAPTEGNLMELDAIAAVVIGGTSLSGGQGTIVGSIIGAFLIGTLNNGMDLLGIDSNYQMVVKGIIIIFAVWSDAKAKRK